MNKRLSNKYNMKFTREISHKNLGIQIFRMLLCFWVVLDHCLGHKINRIFRIRLHVPCFILISFYFSYKIISGRNTIKIKKRFERLLIPYFIFPIIVSLINNFSFHYFNFSIFRRKINFHDLFIQFAVGRQFILVFWFQFFLIWTSLLFIIISFLFKKKFILIIQLIYITSNFLIYSKINYNFFRLFGSSVRYSIGQIAEVMSLSIIGFIIGYLNILIIIQKYYKRTIFFSFIGLLFLFRYNIFSFISTNTFGGLTFDIGSILGFLLFYFLPLNNIKYQIFYKIICQITNYTQGIYSLHLLLDPVLANKINSVKSRSFNGCIIIYIVCYFISFLGEKLTRKTKLIYLFV